MVPNWDISAQAAASPLPMKSLQAHSLEPLTFFVPVWHTTCIRTGQPLNQATRNNGQIRRETPRSRRLSRPAAGAARNEVYSVPTQTSHRSSATLPPGLPDLSADPAVLSRRVARTEPREGFQSRQISNAEDSRLALAGLAHDARNMLAALNLYCDLLADPGVLALQHLHYAEELRLVAQACGRLVESLGAAASGAQPGSVFSTPIDDLGREVTRSCSLLASLAGSGIRLEVECLPCPGHVGLSAEDLTRILVNLVRNACEAMPEGGRIRVAVQRGAGASFLSKREDTSGPQPTVLVCVQDNGPGIPADVLDRLFEPGFTTKPGSSGWAAPPRRGFGLGIVRQLAENAGGTARAFSRQGRGTRVELELPLRASLHESNDIEEGTCVQC